MYTGRICESLYQTHYIYKTSLGYSYDCAEYALCFDLRSSHIYHIWGSSLKISENSGTTAQVKDSITDIFLNLIRQVSYKFSE